MLTDGCTDRRTHGRMDDGRKVITIAHPEQSSGELKIQELWFLCSVCGLMLTDICMKFREDSLNGFQVIEWTQFCDIVQGQ